MKIILHGINIELTPAIKSYVDQKIGVIEKLFPKTPNDLIEARVEVGKPSRHHHSGQVYYAELNLKVGGKLIRGNIEDYDLYVAIDKVRDEVERQILKFKQKRADIAKRTSRAD
jgi:putative sigma-54 modulation protein